MFNKIGTLITTSFFGRKVGIDENKNTYYISKNYKKRWVIYHDENDASSVPPEWQSWLTKTADKIPENVEKKYSWQLKHTANNTGSINSRNIKANNDGFYKAWSPKKRGSN